MKMKKRKRMRKTTRKEKRKGTWRQTRRVVTTMLWMVRHLPRRGVSLLRIRLWNGLYTTFQGIHGPAQDLNPKDKDVLEYLRLLWPESLCDLIALETDRYANQKGVTDWVSVSVSEVWSFLGIVILMGVHRLPRIRNYWSKDCFLGLSALQECMSLSRFWALWSNLHVVDNQCIEPRGGVSRKM